MCHAIPGRVQYMHNDHKCHNYTSLPTCMSIPGCGESRSRFLSVQVIDVVYAI